MKIASRFSGYSNTRDFVAQVFQCLHGYNNIGLTQQGKIFEEWWHGIVSRWTVQILSRQWLGSFRSLSDDSFRGHLFQVQVVSPLLLLILGLIGSVVIGSRCTCREIGYWYTNGAARPFVCGKLCIATV